MKTKTYIFSLLLLLFFSSSAQNYKSCLDGEITRWSLTGYFDFDGPEESVDIVAYGDTVINATVYKKLFYDGSFPYYDAEESNTNWQNHTSNISYSLPDVYIRESADASKLYLYNSYLNEEILFSDMSLQQGDTFHLLDDYFNASIKAIVDSIYFENELKHIVLKPINPYRSQQTLIEGIGSNIWRAISYFHIFAGDIFLLNCFQNQAIFYKMKGIVYFQYYLDYTFHYCGCLLSPGGTKDNVKDDYQVFVHKEKIELLFSDNMNVDVFVYDIHGKLYHTTNDVFDRNIIIPTTAFSNGLYILNIVNRQNRQTSSKKIIIQ
jgi:hypothetical protein